MAKVELEDLIKFSKTIKVLYVDDDLKHRESAFGVFKIFFHEIDTARNGEEGFQKFLDNKYNLIITDINMSKMNGIEMITKIREVSKNITVLIMSSDEDKRHFMDLIKLGVDGYILKPVKIPQFVEVIQKIIEKFQNKQELFEYKNSLEAMVETKTNELIHKNNLLKENEIKLQERIDKEVHKNIEKNKQLYEQSKMASMGEMIVNISHQWRQPLSCISTGITGMKMQKEFGVLKDEAFYSICTDINKNAQHLSQTIDDFRNYISDDTIKDSFYLDHCIKSLIRFISSSYKDKNINIDIDIEKDIEIYGSINELKQCLIHLFNNSIDKLSTIVDHRYIQIKAFSQNHKTVLLFKDNAGGIKEDIIDHIFEPYFTTKHKSLGTGLGLNITFNIIHHALKGTIGVKNVEYLYNGKTNKGAEFRLVLPSSK